MVPISRGFDLKGYEVRPNNWVGLSTCFLSVVVKSKMVWGRYAHNIRTHISLFILYLQLLCHVKTLNKKSDLRYESVFDFLLRKRAVSATKVVFGG